MTTATRGGALLVLAILAAPGARAEAPVIDHKAVGCIVAGKYPRMDACFAPESVVQPRVYFRAEGTTPWFYVEMKPAPAVNAKAGCLSGALPRPSKKLVGKHVEYYLEASDTAFNPGRTAEFGPLVVRSEGECDKDTPVAPLSREGPAGVFPSMPGGFSAGGGLGTAAILGGVLGAGAIAGGAVALTGDDEPAQHALQVARAGAGTGSVTSTPGGIACGGTCQTTYPQGTQVRLTATPAHGSSFAGWEGACSGTGECLVTMDAPKSVTARFGLRATLSVLVTGNGAGTVSSAPAGIDCGANCTATYDSGTTVVLTAQPAGGSAFAGWSGGGCSGTGPCTVVMDANRAVTATFTAGVRLTVVKAGTGTGTVESDPPGIDCGARCTSGFDLGATVTLRATAAAGSRFTGWTGAGCSGTDACTVVMDSSKSVTATFEGQVPLRVSVTGSGSGVVSSAPAGIKCSVGDVGACSASYPSGTLVELTATPQAGTVFGGWGGDCAGTAGNQCVVTMDAAKFVTAAFSGRKTLTVVKAGAGGGTVTSLPAGINCGGTCSAQFDFGTSVTLSAAPDTSSIFAGWSGGGCSGTGTCTVVMNADITVTATFAPARFNLTVTVDGPGTVSDSLGQIVDCRTTCTASYPNGSTVNLTATAVGTGAVFMGWSGACTGTGGCSVLMDQNKAVTATFGWPLTVRLAGTGSGTVTSSPAGINCGTDCDEVYRQGTSVTLTATPAAGSTFTGWTGGGCTGTGTCTVTMNSAVAVSASFSARRTLTVTVTIGAFGTGGTIRSASSQPGEPLIVCTAPPSGTVCTATYDNGMAVTLNAATNDFITWTGCTVVQPDVCTVTMDANRAVTAEFFSLGARSAKGGSGDAGPSGPGAAWVSLLEVPGAEGQLTFNGQQAAFAGPGMTRVTLVTRPGENSVEGRLQSAGGQPGTWRFELQSRDLMEPGSLRVTQGDPVVVLPDAIVFRLAGRPGERVGFTFRLKP